jgi:Asp-tRNA(Asn)/Glu-tRNA(Gln) amidotransferase C subunit
MQKPRMREQIADSNSLQITQLQVQRFRSQLSTILQLVTEAQLQQ